MTVNRLIKFRYCLSLRCESLSASFSLALPFSLNIFSWIAIRSIFIGHLHRTIHPHPLQFFCGIFIIFIIFPLAVIKRARAILPESAHHSHVKSTQFFSDSRVRTTIPYFCHHFQTIWNLEIWSWFVVTWFFRMDARMKKTWIPWSVTVGLSVGPFMNSNMLLRESSCSWRFLSSVEIYLTRSNSVLRGIFCRTSKCVRKKILHKKADGKSSVILCCMDTEKCLALDKDTERPEIPQIVTRVELSLIFTKIDSAYYETGFVWCEFLVFASGFLISWSEY